MTDTTVPAGWSGVGLDGNRVFVAGAPLAETALTAVITYALPADLAAAQAAANAALIPFANLQANAMRAMDAACAAAITGGFSSSALGAPHWYGSQETDQLNLGGDMVAAATVGQTFTADIGVSTDQGVTWAMATHSAAQVATVFNDLRTWRIAQTEKNRALQAAIAAATTPAALAAIVWA